MNQYTPAEWQILERLRDTLLEQRYPVLALRVFGSRARGHSGARSDLDIAVVLDAAPDNQLGQALAALGERLSMLDEDTGFRLHVQIVPLFRGDANGFFAHSIAPEADTVWTRT